MDQGKKVKEISDRVATVVLAGGEGTRLFPLTRTRCKPSVAFGGRYRLIDVPLSNSLNSKINRIFVISQYFASDLHKHILGTYPGDLFQKGDIQLLCPEETPDRKVWFKGTADAVRQNLEHILKSSADYFLILSGDQLYNCNFTNLLQFAKENSADLVIASLPVKTAEAKRMGLLKIDKTCHVQEFFEKPSDPAILKKFELPASFCKEQGFPERKTPTFLGSMGIYVFSRKGLTTLLKEEGDDFGRHLIPTQVKRGKTFAYVFHGYWEDIGTIGSFYTANLALLTEKECLNTYDESQPIYTHPHLLPSPVIKNTAVKNSLLGQGAIIEAKEITHSIVGVRSQIKKGSIIRDSILLGHQFYHPPGHHASSLPKDFTIGENCIIERAIIDEHTKIGNGVMLTNKKGLNKYDGDGVYIRDGIIIVTSGTSLPNGFVL